MSNKTAFLVQNTLYSEVSDIPFSPQVDRDSRSDSEESEDADSDGKEAKPDDKVIQNGKKKL